MLALVTSATDRHEPTPTASANSQSSATDVTTHKKKTVRNEDRSFRNVLGHLKNIIDKKPSSNGVGNSFEVIFI